MPTPREIVQAYAALWNENDAAARAKLIEACWSDGGTIYIAERSIAGRTALEEEVARFRAGCPDDRAVMTSDIAFVDRWFRFAAEVRRPDGTVYSRMLDFGEFGPDGLIARIVTFLAD